MDKPVYFWGGLGIALALWGGSVWVSRAGANFPLMPPYTQSVMPIFAVQDTAMVLNGARRFGADLALIQMMQYYGSTEYSDPATPYPIPKKEFFHSEEDHEEKGREHGHGHSHGHLHLGNEGQAEATGTPSLGFPLLADFALRAGTLDPRFHFVYMFVSGALAFNLNRGDDAVRVLEQAIRSDPTFPRYRMYLGAIAYRKNQEVDKVIVLLEEAIKDPDCPSMIKNILAHIYIKNKNYTRAAQIYIDLLASRDPSYATHAEDQLIKLGVVPK